MADRFADMSTGGEWTLTEFGTWTMLDGDAPILEHWAALMAYILADMATGQGQSADRTACDLLQFFRLGALHYHNMSTPAGMLNRGIARGVFNVLRLVALQILNLFTLSVWSLCFRYSHRT